MEMMDFYLLPHAMQCNLNGNERLVAHLALAFEPSDVMDSLKAVTSGQDQGQPTLLERQLFLPGCMDILLRLH